MKGIKEAIILAGGLGTRLRDTVPGIPKCMAPVAGKPFLFYVINALRLQGIEQFIFSLGYKHELIEEYLKAEFPTLRYKNSIESEPLGTGGAISLAGKLAESNTVLIANGDTLFHVDVAEMAAFHEKNNAVCTLALKPMTNFERYGVVEINETGAVTSFKEKQHYTRGNINGGVYLLDIREFQKENFPGKFSFEKDFLEKKKAGLYGITQNGYFIDIGIPEDFERAQVELKPALFNLQNINKDWTLFLDRDGVINIDKDGSYIFSPDEFIFMEGAPALFKKLADRFGHIVVITNQRGVGRGLMTEVALTAIHDKMIAEIRKAGGRIDAIYYCTSVDNQHPMRKPNPGMAFLAKRDHPDIDFGKSVMVGNNLSDMKFGRNAGMHTVFVKTTQPAQVVPHPDIDMAFPSLAAFAEDLNDLSSSLPTSLTKI